MTHIYVYCQSATSSSCFNQDGRKPDVGQIVRKCIQDGRLKNVQLLRIMPRSSLSILPCRPVCTSAEKQQQWIGEEINTEPPPGPSSFPPAAFSLLKARARANAQICADQGRHFYLQNITHHSNQTQTMPRLKERYTSKALFQLCTYRQAPGTWTQGLKM